MVDAAAHSADSRYADPRLLRLDSASWRLVLGSWALALAGCRGPQSTLDPAGREAEQIGNLFWWMFGGGTAVWLVMVSLTLYALFLERRPHSEPRTRLWIIMGGTVFPTLLLTVLLCFGLALLPKLVAPAPEGSLVVRVHGVQWWWRVRYEGINEQTIELANEVCIPVGEPIEFQLESEDVIHSFWIPSIGGKVDMIPGRTTRLVLHPTRTGLYRGVCAEYCGTSHALMNFYVRVVSRPEFDDWLVRQGRDAATPQDATAQAGQRVFLTSGCGACHTVRGTTAQGVVGPDLTHFGSRHSLGAGLMPNDSTSIDSWLRRTVHLKPDVEMPAFDVLGEERLAALNAYLRQLQ